MLRKGRGRLNKSSFLLLRINKFNSFHYSPIMENILKTKKHFLLWCLFALSFIVCYFSTFQWLNYKYQAQDSYYSHGYLIPIVSAYLIYLRRKEIREVPLKSTPIGLGVIMLALAIHIFGVLGDINFISGFSMVLYLLGCSLYLFGTRITWIIAFPLGFLIFMCPIPEAYIDIVALPSKAMATSLALHFMDLVNIPYVREGFFIHLAHSTFVVGTPCNGMRSFISFTALGLLMLYLFRTSWWNRILFLVVVPPLALLLNGVRIALLLLIAHTYGGKAASPESYLHDGSGVLVFIIGFGLLMLFSHKLYEKR